MFNAWKSWCESQGRKELHGTVQTFGRDLRATQPGVDSKQQWIPGTKERHRVYVGIDLNP